MTMLNSSDNIDSDQDLVCRCLQGDMQSQCELVDRYSGLCISIARKILGSQGAEYVDDAVQESLTSIFARLHQWHGHYLAAWIGTVAARRAIDVRRRIARWRRESPMPNIDEIAGADSHGNWQGASDLLTTVEHLSRTFSDRQKRVLGGMLDGYTRHEIAERLTISERTVYQEVAEIRRRLTGILNSFAGNSDSDRH